ncbi:MAG: DUF1566 domain-containing protein [Bacteroidetes bacterium]|nr:MAG: DUF1566 domain-containing protein [Bacteroidota bacterium]
MKHNNGLSHTLTLLRHITNVKAAAWVIMHAVVFSGLIGSRLQAQTPEAFHYQAVTRNSAGQPIADQSVSLRISILSGSVAGPSVYTEIHNEQTNSFGLINIEIGTGNPVSGAFSSIDWGSNSYFLQVELDTSGGSAFELLGTTQLVSVPYALHAKTAERVSKKYKIGDVVAGGIIFWLDESGEHGLVAAPSDLSDSLSWSNGILRITNASGEGVGAGYMNTLLLIAQQTQDNPTGDFAAKLCAGFSITDNTTTIQGNWYLPSKYELNQMYTNLHLAGLGGFANAFYWSSTEADLDDGWLQDFGTGDQGIGLKSSGNRVRAIRAF